MKRFGVATAAVVLALVLVSCASAPSRSGSSMAYTGYLMDKACGTGGKGMDGSDVVNSPQDHTKECLVACEASGFGIAMKDGNAYRFVAFDKAGSDLAQKTILDMTTKEKGIGIEVEGTMRDGMIVVTAIREAAQKM